MLIDFAITNYRSIKDRQVFSMLTAGKVKELPDNVAKIDKNINLLKTAIIYGRNASGKSNFLKGFQALRYIVELSNSFRLDEKISFYDPYRLDNKCIKEPVEFEINFIGEDKVRYAYLIAFNERKILKESLFYYPKNRKTKLFIREENKPIDFGDVIKGNKKDLEKSLYPNQLFLSKVGTERIEHLEVPYRELTHSLLVNIANFSDFDKGAINILIKALNELDVPNFKNNVNKLLHVADTGITSLSVNEINWKDFRFPENISEKQKNEIIEQHKYQIKLRHPGFENGVRKGEVEFNLEDESSGTIRLLAICGALFSTIISGSVYIIDELEKSLHPKLTQTLIYMFNNPRTNPKNAQLIFATHDVTLLSNEIFRRDQIWFTDKESNGATTLYSLADLKDVRNTVPYEKYYMRGAFGATPVINEYDMKFNFDEI